MNEIKNPKKYNTSKKRLGLNFRFFGKLMIVLVAFLIVSYIIIINDLSIKGFVLKDMKGKIGSIKEENKMLELQIMRLESSENIAKKAEELKLVKVENIEYVTVASKDVAKK